MSDDFANPTQRIARALWDRKPSPVSDEEYEHNLYGNRVGVFGKMLGGLGLDASGERKAQPWSKAIMSTLDAPAGLASSIGQAVTAPARAYRGEIPEDQMIPEGLNFAGSVALGSAAVPRPRGSVGMGSLKEGASHLDMSPEARMARAREMGLDTKGYHWTGTDFDEFKPHPYRGASFFGRTAEDASRGATAGANDGTGTGSSKLREVMLPGGEIMGLALTPAERRWWSGLPERAGEGEITSILEQRPSDLSSSAKAMPWYYIYDEKRLPDGSFSYTKMPEPRLSWDEAARSERDIYGEQWPHYNPGSERFSSDYAKQNGMSGYTHQDEAGLSIGMVDPTRIRDVNAAFDPAKSSSANLLAANPETSAAPGLGLMADDQDTMRRRRGLTAPPN